MYLLPEQKKQFTPELFVPQPVRIVLEQLGSGNKDFADVARRAGFRDRQDLTAYMKAQGWLWSSERETYIKETSADGEEATEVGGRAPGDKLVAPETSLEGQSELGDPSLENFLPLLNFLQENQEQLEELLDLASLDTTQIPHYRYSSGVTVTKSVTMSTRLDQLIRDFSAEMGVTQRIIVEAALIQFMEKYGYAKQVGRLLQS